MKEKLKQINDYEWQLPKEGKMNVNGMIIGNKAIIDGLEDDTIGQIMNVTQMPGVLDPVIALPDAHFGYGLPMGSVAAFDAEKGVISAGLCGFDINCGVNSIRTNLAADEVIKKIKELITALFDAVPCGVGSKGKLKLDDDQLNQLVVERDEFYREKCKTVTEPLPGVVKLLKDLKDKNIKLGVASSTSRDNLDYFLPKINVLQYFDCTLAGTEVSHGKPNPEIYLKLCEMLGANPVKCVGLEDTDKGVAALKNAGIKAIVVTLTNRKEYDFSKADLVVKTFDELNTSTLTNLLKS